MAYLIPFKFQNFDMLNGVYIDKEKNIICKIKAQSYDKLVISKGDMDEESKKIVLGYTDKDKKIEKIIENFLTSNGNENDIIPINDKITIAEIKTIFAPKKLKILRGQRLYEEILEKNEEYFTAFLKVLP